MHDFDHYFLRLFTNVVLEWYFQFDFHDFIAVIVEESFVLEPEMHVSLLVWLLKIYLNFIPTLLTKFKDNSFFYFSNLIFNLQNFQTGSFWSHKSTLSTSDNSNLTKQSWMASIW